MTPNKQQLVHYIRELAIVRQPVILSSEKGSDYYIDMRRVTLDGLAAPVVGRAMRELVADLEFDAVGGLTLGADPVAMAMLHTASVEGQQLDAFVVRKSEKTHGMQRRIEGTQVSGQRVLIVEDTCTTGNSALTAVEVVQSAGGEVVAVAAIVSRNTDLISTFSEVGLEYRYVVSASELGLP